MPWPRVGAVAGGVAAILYLMLDSGAVARESPPPGISLSLCMLAVIFGIGAGVMWAGGQRERTPLLAGLALGVGGYAILRMVAF